MGHVAWPHPVSLSWVSGKIDGDKIAITYKILAEDLIYFHQPALDENYDFELKSLRLLTKKHGELITEYFRIKSKDGQYLEPKLIGINDRSLAGDKVNVMDLMKLDIYYRFEYHLPSDHWEELTFYQNIGSHKAALPSITFLSLYENGETLLENMELAIERPITVKPGEKQFPFKPSELTSSYFTLSQGGIRHELTIPSATFNALIMQTQPTDAPLVDRVEGYFKLRNPIFNNNSKLTPQLANITSLSNDDHDTGFMYIDIIYPTLQYPENTIISWDDYNWQFKWFNSNIITIDSLYKHTFSRYQPIIKIKSEIIIDLEND